MKPTHTNPTRERGKISLTLAIWLSGQLADRGYRHTATAIRKWPLWKIVEARLFISTGPSCTLREWFDQRAELQRCKKCGCTADNACDGGCEWVSFDLCSACCEDPMR
jgi:hypothetical protein